MNSKRLYYIGYYYSNEAYARIHGVDWDSLLLMNKEQDGKLISAQECGRITVDSLKIEKYVIWTGHFIRKTDTLQSFWNTYIPKDKACRKDTFHIETVKVFQQKHPHILERMLNGDSIQFWYRTLWSKEDGVPCYLPVEIK
jgi:hypothetical protein